MIEVFQKLLLQLLALLLHELALLFLLPRASFLALLVRPQLFFELGDLLYLRVYHLVFASIALLQLLVLLFHFLQLLHRCRHLNFIELLLHGFVLFRQLLIMFLEFTQRIHVGVLVHFHLFQFGVQAAEVVDLVLLELVWRLVYVGATRLAYVILIGGTLYL